MKKDKVLLLVTIIVLAISSIGIFYFTNKDDSEIKTVKSEKELNKIYEGDELSDIEEIALRAVTMPFSMMDIFTWRNYNRYYAYEDVLYDGLSISNEKTNSNNGVTIPTGKATAAVETTSVKESGSTKDYSTTNIQVENVDEADIIKTDGDYIYSLSENKVIITNVKDPQNIKVENKISYNDGSAPIDLILYKNKLVVISEKSRYNSNTIVKIYDITNKQNLKIVKSYELDESYYTSRCIENNLYVISSGYLKKENDNVKRSYTEDGIESEIPLKNIKYLKDVKTTSQTLIAEVDLNNIERKINVQSYLINISNAYVSENAIYLLNYKYDGGYDYKISIGSIFGFKGLFGIADEVNKNYYSSSGKYLTSIYKFDIKNNGQVEYRTKGETEGRTINQYSLDEKDGNLRTALYDSNGARVVIFDSNMNEIGKTQYVAKGETMYSSRFMGDKAYLVTYKNMDPLFVIDLSNVRQPKVLGELHIPGYSTYLHPYDENHLIGIGMETEETTSRDNNGRVISTGAKVIGMKMALFDVSNVNNPIEIDSTVIGDRRTTSAILTNPKALLFSKQKNLIAIPVNNYNEDFEVEDSDNYETMIKYYTNYNKKYVSEGYLVYNIDLTGFDLKAFITHDAAKNTYTNNYYYLPTRTNLLRGLYIENNLYTVSENEVKVNNLDNFELVSDLKIK